MYAENSTAAILFRIGFTFSGWWIEDARASVGRGKAVTEVRPAVASSQISLALSNEKGDNNALLRARRNRVESSKVTVASATGNNCALKVIAKVRTAENTTPSVEEKA